MKTRMTILLLSCWAGSAGTCIAQEPTPKPSLDLTIRAPQTAVAVGARMPLLVTMTNISDRDLTFGVTTIYGLPLELVREVGVVVHGSDGRRVAETRYGLLIYGRFGGANGPGSCCIRLRPGDSFMEESDLNKEFDLSKPGEYTAEAFHFGNSGTGIAVASNKVSFTVVAADQEAEAPKPSFSISIAASGTSVRAGAPIVVTAAMTNISHHEVPVIREFNYTLGKEVPRRLFVQVLDSRGGRVPATGYGEGVHPEVRSTYVGSIPAAVLKPGESYQEEADLSKEFQLTAPGTYTVAFWKRDPDTGQRVSSNQITLTVTR